MEDDVCFVHRFLTYPFKWLQTENRRGSIKQEEKKMFYIRKEKRVIIKEGEKGKGTLFKKGEKKRRYNRKQNRTEEAE